MKIRVKVIPNARTEEVAAEGDLLVIKVKEPPREGKANRAVIRALAQHLDVPQDSVRISSGFRSRNKTVEVSESGS